MVSAGWWITLLLLSPAVLAEQDNSGVDKKSMEDMKESMENMQESMEDMQESMEKMQEELSASMEEEMMGKMPIPECFQKDKEYIGYPMNTPEGDRYIKNCPNPQHCQVMCQRAEECEWFNWTNGTCPMTGKIITRCWMKSGKGNLKAKPGGMTGPARCKHEKKRSCIEDNRMYVGDGLNVWKIRGNNFGRQKTAARCQDLCKRTRGCKWFNWNSKSQCWLKRSHGQKGAPNVRHEEGVSTGPRECPKMPAEHSCDDGWIYFQGKCYLVHLKMDKLKATFADVKQNCTEKGASLVSFKSKKEFEFITDVMDRNQWQQNGTQFWIGAKRVGDTKVFNWENDNTAVDLTWDAWDKDDDDTPGPRNCLQLFKDSANNWAYEAENCDEEDQYGSYICKKPANEESSEEEEDGSGSVEGSGSEEEITTEAANAINTEQPKEEGSGKMPPCPALVIDNGMLNCVDDDYCILSCLPGYSAYPHHHYKCTGGKHLTNSDGEHVYFDKIKCSPAKAVVGGCSVSTNQTMIQISNSQETCMITPLPGDNVCHHGYTLNYLDGMLLACGGTHAPNKCMEYDHDTNTWVDAADLLVERMGSTSVVIDNKMYIIGGKDTKKIEIISFDSSTMSYRSNLDPNLFPYEVTSKDCMVGMDDTLLTLTSRDEHFFSYNISSGIPEDLTVPFERSLKVPCALFMSEGKETLMVENVIDDKDGIELSGYVYDMETKVWAMDSQTSFTTGHLVNIDGGNIARISLRSETNEGRAALYNLETKSWEGYGTSMTLAQSSIHGPVTTIPSILITCKHAYKKH